MEGDAQVARTLQGAGRQFEGATADGGVYIRIAVSAPLVRIERAVLVVLESTKPPDKVGGLRTEDDRS